MLVMYLKIKNPGSNVVYRGELCIYIYILSDICIL